MNKTKLYGTEVEIVNRPEKWRVREVLDRIIGELRYPQRNDKNQVREGKPEAFTGITMPLELSKAMNSAIKVYDFPEKIVGDGKQAVSKEVIGLEVMDTISHVDAKGQSVKSWSYEVKYDIFSGSLVFDLYTPTDLSTSSLHELASIVRWRTCFDNLVEALEKNPARIELNKVELVKRWKQSKGYIEGQRKDLIEMIAVYDLLLGGRLVDLTAATDYLDNYHVQKSLRRDIRDGKLIRRDTDNWQIMTALVLGYDIPFSESYLSVPRKDGDEAVQRIGRLAFDIRDKRYSGMNPLASVFNTGARIVSRLVNYSYIKQRELFLIQINKDSYSALKVAVMETLCMMILGLQPGDDEMSLIQMLPEQDLNTILMLTLYK